MNAPDVELAPQGFDADDSDLTPLTDSDVDNDDSCISSEDDSDYELKPRSLAKRRRLIEPKSQKKAVAKARPKKVRAFRGVLKDMWALPLDVTYEVRIYAIDCTKNRLTIPPRFSVI